MQEHRESPCRPAGSRAPAGRRAWRRRPRSRARCTAGRAARRAPRRRPGRSSCGNRSRKLRALVREHPRCGQTLGAARVACRLRAVACRARSSLLLGGCYVLQAASGQAEVIRRSEPIDERAGGPGDARRDAHGSLELVGAARTFAIERARAARRQELSRATRTWAGPTSCTTSSPRPSSRSNRAAGAFRSRAASPTAAISTRQRARAYGLQAVDARRRRERGRRPDVLDAGAPAGSGVRFDARLARYAPRRHDLPRAGARAALLRGRQRVQRGVRERGRGRGHPPLAAAAGPGRRDRRATRRRWRGRRSSRRCCAMRAAGSRGSMRRACRRRRCASRSSASSAGSSSDYEQLRAPAGAAMPATTAGLRAR